MADVVLVVNAGSSSVKFSTFVRTKSGEPALMLRGQVERIDTQPRLIAKGADNVVLADQLYDPATASGHDGAISAISDWLGSVGRGQRLLGAGHRVVHGGLAFGEATLVDDRVIAELDQLVPLMPLHQPANLAGIRALRRRRPTLPQVACFDSAFHRGRSQLVERFALPDTLYREGLRRYGFHGLSYEYIAGQLQIVAPSIATARVIVAHLGSGASMCAMRDGRSVDSTMAFSALDGLPMGTRCGALDPGVVLYLIREKGMSVDAVERLLYRECGLRGLSGLSADMRDLEASDAPAATLARDYFVHHACRQIGLLAAELEGVDAIVFTAGIGEHSPTIREQICRRLGWLGLAFDAHANLVGGPCITMPQSRVSAWVIPTNEELVIARHTLALIGPSPPAAAS